MICPGFKLPPEQPLVPEAVTARIPACFDWASAVDAANLLHARVSRFLELNPFAPELFIRLRDETGTDFFDWIDHLVLRSADEKALREVGFETQTIETPNGETVLHHPRTNLPRIIISKDIKTSSVVALRVESVADFAAAHRLTGPVEGKPDSRYRKLCVQDKNGTRLEVVERNAYPGFVTSPIHAADLRKKNQVVQLWREMNRTLKGGESLAEANRLLDTTIDLSGRDLVAQFFFAEERRHWAAQNFAARTQKERQDALGLGWGNQDACAYRCAPEHFEIWLDFLARLGFQKRERFQDGKLNVQVLEQNKTGLVVLVDAGGSEESSLFQGLHYLAVRGILDLIGPQLDKQGVTAVELISNSASLRRAATLEETTGTHLEILERQGGYKGFGQKAAS